MSILMKSRSLIVVPVILALLICFSWAVPRAEETLVLETREAKTIQLVVGKSLMLKSSRQTKSAQVRDPDIAEVDSFAPYEIYLMGKSAGMTNLILEWGGENGYAVYDVVVNYDTAQLKQRLYEILPGETQLRILATGDSLTLAGKISGAAKLSEALAVAQEYAPKGKIHNLVEVGGVQQVMLEVRVAEMQRSFLKRIGINFSFLSPSGKFGIGKLGDLIELADDVPQGASFGLEVSSAVNALFRFNSDGTDWTWFIDALKEEGLLKILAEPTLIAQSGQNAQFLAGGEFPVPVPQGLGTVAIEYKPFGVGLTFTPTVLSDNRINVKVAPEVSELDFSTAVQLEGYYIPGLSTRKAETTIELSDGQSFAVAGLLKDTVRDVVDKYPLLGDIPILGTLFRSRSFQTNETELVIIVTPHLIKPLDMAKQSLPTDFYNEPDDFELYLLGLIEGRGQTVNPPIKGELDGDFGHAMPE